MPIVSLIKTVRQYKSSGFKLIEKLIRRFKKTHNGNNGHTSDFSLTSTYVCELCGVVLGTGIPNGFKPNSYYVKNLSKYRAHYKIESPWFCCGSLTQLDHKLSRTVYLFSCGHLYCGRCTANIQTSKSLSTSPKKCVSCSTKFSTGHFRKLHWF